MFDRITPRSTRSFGFRELLEWVNVCDNSVDGKGIYVGVYPGHPYTREVKAALSNFQKTDPQGFDELIRHAFLANAYLGVVDTLSDIVHDRVNVEDWLARLRLPAAEIESKPLYAPGL